jgi:hypothetical protein
MRIPVVIPLALTGVLIASAQSVGTSRRKSPAINSPACSTGTICFSGQVAAGEEFRKSINSELEFVLVQGWTIAVVPVRPEGDCQEFASVVNAPYRAHRALYINATYGWTAEEEVATSPREFRFVTNCADFRTESERLGIVLWPYTATPGNYDEALARLGTSPLGTGRLWIIDSKTTHAGDTADNKVGRIEWMKFTVEIILPQR